MQAFEATHPDFADQVRRNLLSQPFMQTIGASITDIQPGFCEISVGYRDELSHHPGGFHPGIIDTIAMNAAGYATYTISKADTPYAILTVEHKFNLLAPPDGDLLIARGRVFKPGGLLTVAHTDVFVRQNGTEKQCAFAVFTKLDSQKLG